MLQLPIAPLLGAADDILIAGCGGGYDIFCGLPLSFGLRAQGKRVHLANLSFSALGVSDGRKLGPALIEITADAPDYGLYFPELHLARWFAGQGEQVPIYGFYRTGVQPLLESYRALCSHLGIEAVVLVDGGTDSLMRGDEAGLGTPQEDVASLAAVHALDLQYKLLVCLGFGIDTYHGVSHAQFLEAVAALMETHTYNDVTRAINRYRSGIAPRPWAALPM